MGWNDFDRLENQHYEAMFAEWNTEYSEAEEPMRWEIEWESESEDCMDHETITADSKEQAVEIFREEKVGEDIPADAVVMAIIKVA